MKKLIIFTVILMTISCKNKEVSDLKNRISELEKVNKKLEDSLSKKIYQDVTSLGLWAIPEKNKLIPNKENEFKFLFHSIKDIPNYNVYRIIENGNEETKELLYQNNNSSSFKFNFIPENNKDESFKILAVFDLDSIIVNIPGSVDMSNAE